MADSQDKISRRGFIRTATVAAAVGATTCKKSGEPSADAPAPTPAKGARKRPRTSQKGNPRFAPPQPRRTGRAKVVLVRDAEVLDARGRVRARVLSRMLDRAVTELTAEKTRDGAWKQLLKPQDVLGIKSNVWKYLRTPVALEKAIFDRAREVGIGAERIRTDDRGARKRLADCTALINARPLRSHHWAGVGGLLKNYIMFDAEPWKYHPDSCADLGSLWNLPTVQGKTRLNVLVMLTPLFHGRGPHHFSSEYLWPYKGLIVSRDPVAADRVGLEILRAKRTAHFGRERPFATRTHHVELADTRHGVGVSDLARIDLVKLGDKEGLLLPG